MRHGRLGFVLAAGLLAALAGCEQHKDPAAPQAAPAVEVSAAPTGTPPPAPGPVSIEPAQVASCDVGAVVTVRWDLRETHPDVADVEIWTGPPGKETIFAAGGFVGEAVTGPWATSGTTFSIRNKANGAEILDAVVGGPACGE